MNIKKAYRSCFLVDVQISDDMVRLQDSGRNYYYISTSDHEAVSSFKSWFKQIFMKSIASNISIFQYEIRSNEEGEALVFIVKFVNLKNDENEILHG